VWEPTLVDSGYELALFDGLNRFYVATEKSQLLGLDLSTPANVFDNYVRAVDLRIQRALRAEADELQTRIDESSRKHSVLADQLDDAHQKLYEASRRISALGIDLQTASTRASAAEQQARERLRALERHVEELQALYATASWRATRPLRALALRARALRTRRARSD
jgi:septal ring factor EnvC (AmiA/AmiB activator)